MAAYAHDDALSALERGDLPDEPSAEPRAVPHPTEAVRLWAVELGLRPGGTEGPRASALVKVVGAWARARGLPEPGYRDVGWGLSRAGLYRRRQTADMTTKCVLLHGEDSRRLRRMCREAWAPEDPPGMVSQRTGRPRGRPKGSGRKAPHNTYVRPDFHQHRAEHRCSAALADSIGRVWPCAAVAAAALGGAPRAVANRASDLRNFLQPKADVGPLRTAIQANAHWRGVWWRRLTPEEVAAVPQGTKAGDKLRGLGWGLVCQKCGVEPTDEVWSGPHI